MFSLSALVAREAAPEAKDARDESGLIDLKALATSAGKPAMQPLVPTHAALFPFDVPTPPPMALDKVVAEASKQEVSKAPMKRSRALLVGFAGGAVVAAAMIVGMGLQTGRGRPALAAEGAVMGAVREARAAQAAQVAQAQAQAALEQAKVAEAAAADAAVKPGTPALQQGTTRPVVRDTRKAPGTEQGGEVKAPNTGTTTVKADPCNGDLMCAMARATKTPAKKP